MKPVSPPLSSTRLTRLIYFLTLITALFAVYYSYRTFQWKSEVGGWWNLALGKYPPHIQVENTRIGNSKGRDSRERGRGNHRDTESVEDKINQLAQALGMPPADLASAIAVAVRQYVPPASLSSVAAEESGPAVEAMLRGGGDEGMPNMERQQAQATGAAGHASSVINGVFSGMEGFVGMEEP